mmetsp:Transcript_23682/g.35223  ORF Transcript_23682/g.35223 Transcript_23682/m.35223 type:complete len:536 (-) Transcript_23682:174-1781(-)
MRVKLPKKTLIVTLSLLSSPSTPVVLVDAFTGNAIVSTPTFVTTANGFHTVSSSSTAATVSATAKSIRRGSACTLFVAGGGGGNLFRPIKNQDDRNEDEDDDEDDEEEESLYEQFASSEFLDKSSDNSNKITQSFSPSSKPVDWGGEYDTLRSRFDDVKNNKIGPSNTLFRIMTSQTPNEAIMSFINDASPQVVTAMSSTVTNLLGGLTNPSTGMEMIVKANGDKLGSLCFQLQMTGYMFRNAEYVLAIRDLMNINGKATLQDYKNAFDRLDKDQSGFIEANEVSDLLSDVYGEDKIPSFEVDAFLQFFDSNNDGRISWDEFERGLGVVADSKAKESRRKGRLTASAALPGSSEEEDDDEEEDDEDEYDMVNTMEPNISGTVKIEMKNGRVIEVEAKEYIEELKKEAEALKAALSREKANPGEPQGQSSVMPPMAGPQKGSDQIGGIAAYIASLEGDIKSLTKGISPEVVDAMKMLIDFVLDGGPSGRGKERKNDKELEMEIPGSALQQLALWQLVLGYKLREAEATGDYRKMLE